MTDGRLPELRALTGARGIAAWFVVLYHIRFAIAGLPAPVLAVFAKGYLAVDFFFLLSGFVIALTWEQRLRDGGAVRSFWWKRVARVWPLHLAMLGAAVALVALLAATGRSDPVAFPLVELPLHVVLMQNWGFTRALAWNTPAWSISTETAAYLLFPIAALRLDRRGWSIAAVIASIAVPLLLLHLVMARAGAPTLGWEIARFGLIRCLAEFAAGTGIAVLWTRLRDRPRGPALIAGALGIAGLTLSAWHVVPETLAVPVAFAALLLALALTAGMRRNPLEGRAIHYLGTISYATYLSHWLLFYAFKLALVSDPRAVPPALIALYLALVLAASVALHHLVELPAQRRLNGWSLPRRNDRRARALPADGRQNHILG